MFSLIKNTEKRYFRKILLLITSIFLTIILCYTYIAYRNSEDKILKSITESNEKILKNLKKTYVNTDQIFKNISTALYYDPEVTALMYNSEIEYTQVVKCINKIEKLILNAYPSIQFIFIILKTVKFIVRILAYICRRINWNVL